MMSQDEVFLRERGGGIGIVHKVRALRGFFFSYQVKMSKNSLKIRPSNFFGAKYRSGDVKLQSGALLKLNY